MPRPEEDDEEDDEDYLECKPDHASDQLRTGSFTELSSRPSSGHSGQSSEELH